jgi:hypothetical protein
VLLLRQVVTQTTRHASQGEAVFASDKLVSLFELHMASIRIGKLARPTEFGRVMWRDEVEGGRVHGQLE